MRIPGVVSVKLITKPRIDTWIAVGVGLLDVEVQKCCIDSLGEESIGALLHINWRARIGWTTRGVRFGPYTALAIDVSTRRGCPILNVAQLAYAPELTCNLIRTASILQKLARESPMAITLKPRCQAVRIAHLL